MSGLVYVQDAGTGLESETDASWADAANVMGIVHTANTTDHVVNEPDLTPDWVNDELTITDTQVRIEANNITTVDHSTDAGQDIGQKTWPSVTVAALVDGNTITIPSSGTATVYVDVDIEAPQPNQVEFTTSPQDYSLAIAEVDADAEEVNPVNDKPDGSFGALSADGVLSNAIYPTPNDIPEAYEQDGAQVYTESEGLVVFEEDS